MVAGISALWRCPVTTTGADVAKRLETAADEAVLALESGRGPLDMVSAGMETVRAAVLPTVDANAAETARLTGALFAEVVETAAAQLGLELAARSMLESALVARLVRLTGESAGAVLAQALSDLGLVS